MDISTITALVSFAVLVAAWLSAPSTAPSAAS